MEAENAHDFDRCIAAFARARDEIMATGEVWDGHSGVNTLLQENKRGFPDFQFHPESFHHASEAVAGAARMTLTTDDGRTDGTRKQGCRRTDKTMQVSVYGADVIGWIVHNDEAGLLNSGHE